MMLCHGYMKHGFDCFPPLHEHLGIPHVGLLHKKYLPMLAQTPKTVGLTSEHLKYQGALLEDPEHVNITFQMFNGKNLIIRRLCQLAPYSCVRHT